MSGTFKHTCSEHEYSLIHSDEYSARTCRSYRSRRCPARPLRHNDRTSSIEFTVRLESVAIIGTLIVASGVGYAWWITHARSKGSTDLRRDGVVGKATVDQVREGPNGSVEVRYTFRHPFSGARFSRVGCLRPGTDAPRENDRVDIVYAPDDPEHSRLVQELDPQR
jgi:hypothetical protein